MSTDNHRIASIEIIHHVEVFQDENGTRETGTWRVMVSHHGYFKAGEEAFASAEEAYQHGEELLVDMCDEMAQRDGRIFRSLKLTRSKMRSGTEIDELLSDASSVMIKMQDSDGNYHEREFPIGGNAISFNEEGTAISLNEED